MGIISYTPYSTKSRLDRVIKLSCCDVTRWLLTLYHLASLVSYTFVTVPLQDLAGVEYRTSPDLAWAADWCTSMWRGWVRNYKLPAREVTDVPSSELYSTYT